MYEFLTVVYQIDDVDAFKDHRDEVFSRFCVSNKEFPDWRVTAVSVEDEITRVEQLEENL